LNEVGAHIIKDKQIFYPGHKVLSISLLENGDILTRVEHKFKTTIFVSKKIVLSNGATQKLHANFHSEWFPDCKKVILSNHFLTKVGYNENVSKHKKITIVGASHSGFSCAWLFLNGE
jgi:lysine/ornithine N-monooxygenase